MTCFPGLFQTDVYTVEAFVSGHTPLKFSCHISTVMERLHVGRSSMSTCRSAPMRTTDNEPIVQSIIRVWPCSQRRFSREGTAQGVVRLI